MLSENKLIASNNIDAGLYEIEINKEMQISASENNFISFYGKNTSSYGFLFEKSESSKKFYELIKGFVFEFSKPESFFMFNLIKNKKDESLKRGSLIRTIALCSSSLNIMYHFDPIVRYYLNIFSDFSPKQLLKLDLLLNEVYKNINDLIKTLPLNNLYLNPTENIEVPFEFEEELERQTLECKLKNNKKIDFILDKTFFKNFMDVSLLEFVKKFLEKTMLIYNAILNEERVLFIGHDTSTESTCNMVNACITLVNPLNVSDRIFPYEHLLNVDFVEKNGYIAGVCNPIFASKKHWWDIW